MLSVGELGINCNNYMLKDKLQSQWGIWFAYLSESEERESGYKDRLNKVHTIESIADLAYLWTHSPIASLTNFFVFNKPEGNHTISYAIRISSYQIENEWQKINAVNVFKGDIEPKWEHPENSKGGRLVFQVDKDQENFEDIYQALMFYLIGENFQGHDRINGFRFVSAKSNISSTFFFRVEIWVNFDNQQTEYL